MVAEILQFQNPGCEWMVQEENNTTLWSCLVQKTYLLQCLAPLHIHPAIGIIS